MKKKFAFFLAIILFSSLFSLEKISGSLFIQPELINGFIKEYVFNNHCMNTDNKESQLDWDIKNIKVLKFGANVDIVNTVFIQLDGFYGGPKTTGVMQDYDWLNSVTAAWLLDAPTELTNYSIHTNKLDNYYNFGFTLGTYFYPTYSLILMPFVHYEYNYIKLSGWDGYGIYKEIGYDRYDYSGNVITYIQKIDSVFLGAKLEYEPFYDFFIDYDIELSPALTFINPYDYHRTRNILFYDQIRFKFQLKSNVQVKYFLNKHNCISFGANVQFIPLSKGQDYSHKTDSKGNLLATADWIKYSGVNGGTSRFLYSFNLNYSFNF